MFIRGKINDINAKYNSTFNPGIEKLIKIVVSLPLLFWRNNYDKFISTVKQSKH